MGLSSGQQQPDADQLLAEEALRDRPEPLVEQAEDEAREEDRDHQREGHEKAHQHPVEQLDLEHAGLAPHLQDLEHGEGGDFGQVALDALAQGGPLAPGGSALAQLPSSPLDRRAVLVDGAERLGPMSFRRVAAATRSAPVLVVSRHRAGRLPVLHRCGTSAALLAEIVAELAPEDSSALLPLVPELFRRHRGNLRECLRELYDVCGGRAAALPDHRVKSER